MKHDRAAALSIGLALCGCATPGQPWGAHKVFGEAIPLCDLLADPGRHQGKRVLVRGYLISTPHGREFFDAGCKDGSIHLNLHGFSPSFETRRGRRMREAYDAYVDQFVRRPPLVPVVYSGIFTDHRPRLIAFGSFSLEAARIVALRRRDVRETFGRRERGPE